MDSDDEVLKEIHYIAHPAQIRSLVHASPFPFRRSQVKPSHTLLSHVALPKHLVLHNRVVIIFLVRGIIILKVRNNPAHLYNLRSFVL